VTANRLAAEDGVDVGQHSDCHRRRGDANRALLAWPGVVESANSVGAPEVKQAIRKVEPCRRTFAGPDDQRDVGIPGGCPSLRSWASPTGRSRIARAGEGGASQLGPRLSEDAPDGQPRARARAEGRSELRPRNCGRRDGGQRAGARHDARGLRPLRRTIPQRRTAAGTRRARREERRLRELAGPGGQRARGGARRWRRRLRDSDPSRASRICCTVAGRPRSRDPPRPASGRRTMRRIWRMSAGRRMRSERWRSPRPGGHNVLTRCSRHLTHDPGRSRVEAVPAA
jgi:hypothetical protein